MTRIDSRICPPPYRFDAFRGTSTSSAYDSAGATTASATRALPVRSGRSGSRPMLMENASVTAQQLRTVQLSTRTHLFIHLTSRDCHLHSHLPPPSNRLLYFSPYLHEGTLIESSHRFSLPLRNLGFRVVIDWNFSVKYLSLLSLSLSRALSLAPLIGSNPSGERPVLRRFSLPRSLISVEVVALWKLGW